MRKDLTRDFQKRVIRSVALVSRKTFEFSELKIIRHFSIESAFDSNQSVAGSSVEVLSESSSQISHISQTSQSSIEILDSSRKPSEERRISQVPTLDTIEDHATHVLDETLTSSTEMKKSVELKPKVILTIGNVNLTESSSSGSVCESIVTAYENSLNKSETKLDGIFKTSSLLLSKTPKPKRDSDPVNLESKPIHYNYEDFTIVDHRLKLFLFQNILEENDEKLMWLVKVSLIDEADVLPRVCSALVVMSTKKVYVLKITGKESDDIALWLKKSTTFSLQQVESLTELPSKNGLTFMLREKIALHLLLQDGNVTERLKKHITTSSKLKILIDSNTVIS